ncbi:MAG: 3'(2'),5'-bisphosphate nucleotidase CysQ, partial [Deltaproteobacteria bacterium]|nr:3'(2'),5'-bisphosphate nucleotidase CysQ [Deltaproteobacteria bacterium]
MNQEMSVATNLARAAGRAALAYFRQADLEVETKADASPVSAADRAADAVIIAGLEEAFPKDGILSEEQPDQESWHGAERAWVVDPLDGTADFIAGRDGFSVMIGLMIAHQPVLGVVYQPVGDILYRGIIGGTAERIEGGQTHALVPSGRAAPDEIRLVVSHSHRSPRINALKSALGIREEIQKGSVGVKAGLIARGACELYLNPEGHCKLWDTCAPEAILRAAGAKISDMHGAPLVY